MESTLVQFSNEVAKLAREASPSVVAVHGRAHYSSSGVHWRDGVVVTAEHTLRRDEDIQVTLADGKTAPATLAGRDRGTDLAVLRVAGLGASTLQAAPAESARVGDIAVVLGRSRDSGPNASLGIVSAVSGSWRTWRGGQLDQYIRLDAKLFPTSSGGAVIDAQGRVLGIATSVLSRMAGLAIPASTVNRVTNGLLEKGFVARGYLGVGVLPVPIAESLRGKLSLANTRGVIVMSAESGGPADAAGVLVGDILLALDGKTIESLEDLRFFLDTAAAGKKAQAKLLSGGKLTELAITVGALSRADG
jgi:S1-C subfamily serine protease